MVDSNGVSPDSQADEAVIANIVSIMDGFAAAIVSNDVAQIAEFMADEWVIVSENGIATKQDFLGFVESGALSHSAMEHVGEPRIRLHGDTAVFSGRVTNTAHFGGERIDADEWTTDVFAKQHGRWLCVLTHITAVKPD